MTPYVLTVTLNAAVDTTYLMDGFAPGGIHSVLEMHQAAGGKANNVARVLAVLGQPVVATGFAAGSAGRFIQEDLRRVGITPDYEEIPGESRTCLAIYDRKSGRITEIRERGPTVPPDGLERFLNRFQRLLAGAGAAVVSGSLPPGAPPDTYARLVAAARQAGVPVVLDTSGAPLPAALPAGPDVVKPNVEELAAWAGHTDVLAAARQMRAAGAGATAVSLGANGLLWVGPEGVWRAVAPTVMSINTVGSGDSLVAGLVAGRLRGLPLPDVLRLAVACGTANAMTDTVASPDPADIARLLPRIEVTEVSA